MLESFNKKGKYCDHNKFRRRKRDTSESLITIPLKGWVINYTFDEEKVHCWNTNKHGHFHMCYKNPLVFSPNLAGSPFNAYIPSFS